MHRRIMLKKALSWVFGAVVVVAAAVYSATQITPWPAALVFRVAMDRSGIAAAKALEKYVPAGVTARLNERYDAQDSDALLDVFYPSDVENTQRRLTTVVWIHGGGFLSGSKDQIANYLRILAAKGFTTVGVDYSLAPGRKYPTPIKQVNTALDYLQANAARFHLNSSEFFLAGDSAGAQIAAQLANVITAPRYAQEMGIVPSIERPQLRGVLLYCGIVAPEKLNFEKPFSLFLKTVVWSYFGERKPATNRQLSLFSIVGNVTADFPPMFISVGNADPLAPQSRMLAQSVADHGVPVDALFFPDDYAPPLPHEYQFDLDTEAGRIALESSVAFLIANSR